MTWNQVVATPKKKTIFTSKIGEDEPTYFDIYFFKWVEVQPPTTSGVALVFMKDHRWWDDCDVLTLGDPFGM